MDPIQTAKELLERHRSNESEETIVEDVIVEDIEDLETEEVEEVEEDVDEAYMTSSKKKMKKEEDDEDEDDEDDDDEEEVDEATALDSVKGKGKGAKSGTILDVDDNEVPGAKATDAPKGKDTDGKNKSSVKTKPSAASNKIDKAKMKEHIDVMFGSEDLSEDFKSRAGTIFEAALNESLETYIEAVDAHYATQLEEETSRVRENLSEKLNDYMGYVVDEWMRDNELALERGLRGDIAESFMSGLKGLFTSHYIDVPEEKYDLLEEMNGKFDDLTEEINTQIHSNVELKKEIQELKCKEIFHELSEGLVDTEVEKFESLSEGIEFDSTEQYKEKLEVIKEGYFSDASESSVNFDVESNDVDDNNELPKTGTMSNYTNAISRQMKK